MVIINGDHDQLASSECIKAVLGITEHTRILYYIICIQYELSILRLVLFVFFFQRSYVGAIKAFVYFKIE